MPACMDPADAVAPAVEWEWGVVASAAVVVADMREVVASAAVDVTGKPVICTKTTLGLTVAGATAVTLGVGTVHKHMGGRQ